MVSIATHYLILKDGVYYYISAPNHLRTLLGIKLIHSTLTRWVRYANNLIFIFMNPNENIILVNFQRTTQRMKILEITEKSMGVLTKLRVSHLLIGIEYQS